jgi:hypothetical protein
MQTTIRKSLMVLTVLMTTLAPVAFGQTGTPKSPEQQTTPPAKKPVEVAREGTMTIESMGTIIKLLDKDVKSPREGVWQFKIEKTWVIVITDTKANRMRIMVPVRAAEGLSVEELKRITQANFDTALDSRYAIAQKLLWSVYIHPLSELYKRQFIKGIGQTVNLALTYGKTYNSGLLSFGGGDSRGIIRRQLIDKLLKKGVPI